MQIPHTIAEISRPTWVSFSSNQPGIKELNEFLTEKAIRQAANGRPGEADVFFIHWGDLLLYHGEDGWCLSNEILEHMLFPDFSVEKFLDLLIQQNGIREREAFYVRINQC